MDGTGYHGPGKWHEISHTTQFQAQRAYELVVGNLAVAQIFNKLCKPIIFATTHNIFQEFQVLGSEALEAMLDRH